MRIVAALGGNALLKRGEPATLETHRYNARRAARRFALHTGGRAHIGALEDAAALLAGTAGTCVSTDSRGLHLDETPAHTFTSRGHRS